MRRTVGLRRTGIKLIVALCRSLLNKRYFMGIQKIVEKGVSWEFSWCYVVNACQKKKIYLFAQYDDSWIWMTIDDKVLSLRNF